MARGVEEDRLAEARAGVPWRRWGPYLSERQWGTVREDYSDNGDAWSYFTHDQSRSRAYKWGEDGIAGLCDDRQLLCFAVALWNGADPILKERTFGMTNSEGNHGEDVKEYYFHLDATPTSSYLKYRYKYPLVEFPYDDLLTTNRSRGRLDFEYELLDTGAFDDDRYVDVDVEYAKNGPEDVLVRITLANRSADAATVHLLPTLWFRNTWWMGEPRGVVRAAHGSGPDALVAAEHPDLGEMVLHGVDEPTVLFTENETNHQRLWGTPNPAPYVKDAFHDYVVEGRSDAVNPNRTGTKAAAHYVLDVPAGGSRVVQLRLCPPGAPALDFGADADRVFATRVAETDEFYGSIVPATSTPDVHPLRDREGGNVRNREWFHMVNNDVISMPDTWEYPWYASWDLAFHTVALDLGGRAWRLEDLLSGDVFERDGDDTAAAGLYVDLLPRGTHVMAWTPRV